MTATGKRAAELLAAEEQWLGGLPCALLGYAQLEGGVETITYQRSRSAVGGVRFHQVRVAVYKGDAALFSGLLRAWHDETEVVA